MKLLVQTETIIEEQPDAPIISFDFKDSVLCLKINKYKRFQAFAKKCAMMKLLDTKLNDMLLQHLEIMAKKEEEFRNDR